MFRDEEVLVKINSRNIKYYLERGYKFESLGFTESKEYVVKTKDIPENSKIKVNVLCELCSSVNLIGVSKFYMNYNRNNKGYYSCFKCKNVEREKTCIEKYGVNSYSKTDQFKSTESEKWKGIQKGGEKGRKTMIERYGVDSFFKTEEMRDKNRDWMSSEEFKSKSKKSLIDKYGFDSYSKTDEFKNRMYDQKDTIIEKIRQTFLENYGVDWATKSDIVREKLKLLTEEREAKRKVTCMDKYGVDNVSKVSEISERIIQTKKDKSLIISETLLTEWEVYKKSVRKLTRRNFKKLYTDWNGLDYYDSENIKQYLGFSHTHRFYPTVDHKISTYFGFLNGFTVEDISRYENLCITKRFINSIKRTLNEEEFLKTFKPK
jgi:hypothetical protein